MFDTHSKNKCFDEQIIRFLWRCIFSALTFWIFWTGKLFFQQSENTEKLIRRDSRASVNDVCEEKTAKIVVSWTYSKKIIICDGKIAKIFLPKPENCFSAAIARQMIIIDVCLNLFRSTRDNGRNSRGLLRRGSGSHARLYRPRWSATRRKFHFLVSLFCLLNWKDFDEFQTSAAPLYSELYYISATNAHYSSTRIFAVTSIHMHILRRNSLTSNRIQDHHCGEPPLIAATRSRRRWRWRWYTRNNKISKTKPKWNW